MRQATAEYAGPRASGAGFPRADPTAREGRRRCDLAHRRQRGDPGCQVLQLLFIGRLLGATAAGVFALALSVTAPLVLFGNMQLRELYITDTTGRPFSTYCAARLLSTAVALSLISSGACSSDWPRRGCPSC